MKKIGVLTSGGDAPGMNAVIRAVTRAAIAKGMEVVGVRRGYNGLINGDIVPLDARSVSDIIQRGGTMLYTARCAEFRYEEGLQKAKKTCEEQGIEGLVVVGGDGSFRGAADLSARGILSIGVPGTIDNDISMTEYTIGYDTAMNTVVEMVDKLRDTAQSHDRCSVVEVMGRNAGYIALNAGIACGATYIITKEEPFTVNDVIAKIIEGQKSGNHPYPHKTIPICFCHVKTHNTIRDDSSQRAQCFYKPPFVTIYSRRYGNYLVAGSPALPGN